MEEEQKDKTTKLIVIMIVVLALAGMWFCYKVAWMRGAEAICDNSGGYTIIKDSNNYLNVQCLIEYDPLSIHGNNLAIDKETFDKLKEDYKK